MSAHRHLFDGFSAPFLMTDPGASGIITVDRDRAVVPIVTSTTETRTLAQPTKAGLVCTLEMDSASGTCTVTVTGGYNVVGTTTLDLDTDKDWAMFHSVKDGTSYYWRLLNHGGTTATEDFGSMTVTGTLDVTGAVTTAAVPVTTSGIGAKYGTAVAAAEYGDGVLHKTVLTLTANNTTMADEAGVIAYGGTKIYDFPDGAIQVLGAVVDLAVTKSGNGINADFDGDCALGTTVAANADNALSGTEANILASFATNQAVNSVAAVEGQGCTLVAASLNGTATAVDMYLNFLVDDADHNIGTTAAYLLSTGTVTVHWINLGDIA